MQGYGNALGESLATIAVVLAVVCATIGGLVVWAAPKLWGLIKPFIHALTS